MPWKQRLTLSFWSILALTAGFVPAVLIGPYIASAGETATVAAGSANARGAGTTLEGPVPDPFVVPGNVPSAHEVTWRDISDSRPHPKVQEWGAKTTRACMKGPLVADTPTVQASSYPFNYCACMTLNSAERFERSELDRLTPIFDRGHAPKNWAFKRWVQVRRSCQGLSSRERLYPRQGHMS